MGWKNWPFWLKSAITIILVFIIAEIALRIFGYTGCISNRAVNILVASANRLTLLVDNLILFLIVIFTPILLANKFVSKVPAPKYNYSVKGKTLTSSTIKLNVPQDLRHKAEGKGLIYGSIIGAVYSIIDFFLIKLQISSCTNFCGFENLFALASSLAYLSIGIFLFKGKNALNDKQD